MASALRFATRRICGRAFQGPAQAYFTAAGEAAVKEEQRRPFPSISHGGSTVRRFCSSKSPNPVNNNKHAPNSAAGAAEAELTPPPIWSPRSKMFLPLAWAYSMSLCAATYAIVYVEDRIMGPFGSKEQLDNTVTVPHASEKAE